MGLSFSYDLFLVVLTALVGGIVAKKLRQPLIAGYLLAGVLMSFFIGQWRFGDSLDNLAQIGVALLMFTLGLEFSVERLKKVRKGIVWAAIGQMVLVIIVINFIKIINIIDFSFSQAIFLGVVFCLSSTAVVVRLLSEKGELDSLHGQILVAWLLIQDLAVLPLTVFLSNLSNLGDLSVLLKIGMELLKATAIVFGVFFFGRKTLPALFNKISLAGSRELLLLASFSFCLLIAFGASALGLSFAIGAFLAGLLVAETAEKTAALAEIRPLRDLLMAIFFVTLGLMLPLDFWQQNAFLVLKWTMAVIFIKLILSLILLLFLRYHTKVVWLVSLGLANVGEFAFVLAVMMKQTNQISEDLYRLVLAVTGFSLVLAPFLFKLGPQIYQIIRGPIKEKFPQIYERFFLVRNRQLFGNEQISELKNHVVICGHGRVGKQVTRLLAMANLPFLVVDFDKNIINELQILGVNAVFGDPTEIEVLDTAEVDKAVVLVIAVPDRQSQEIILMNARQLNPRIKIICRSHEIEGAKRLYELGAQVVIEPEFEAGLSLGHRVLDMLAIDKPAITGYLKKLREENQK